MQNHWLIVANPASGNGAVRKNLPKIDQVLKEKNISFSQHLSTFPREITEIVKNAIHTEGVLNILGIGGDGTMNEIVNGIFTQTTVPTTDITFTMLPIGTGNDWATTHKIPRNFKQFADFLLSGSSKLQDIGVVKYTKNGLDKTHYFANAGGLAYDSLVVLSVESQKRYIFGKKIAYFLHILKCLWTYEPEKVCIELDGETIEDNFYTINLGINKTSGGGMVMTPQAINNDGLTALTLIRNLPKWKVVYYTSKLRNGTIGDIKKYVSLHQVKNIKINSLGKPVFIETDGEILGETPIETTVLEKKLKIL